ncbi:translation initiation factor IF-2-like [Peromyscus leucopus]|uniref:translation initiation factor IF-2-like n=1 Tax=Peromyscus leucopus TaxID=10041 RepID=UPI0010A10C8B|nr:translation initiation factor IF-2-like [Peromyscus leucopus]
MQDRRYKLEIFPKQQANYFYMLGELRQRHPQAAAPGLTAPTKPRARPRPAPRPSPPCRAPRLPHLAPPRAFPPPPPPPTLTPGPAAPTPPPGAAGEVCRGRAAPLPAPPLHLLRARPLREGREGGGGGRGGERLLTSPGGRRRGRAGGRRRAGGAGVSVTWAGGDAPGPGPPAPARPPPLPGPPPPARPALCTAGGGPAISMRGAARRAARSGSGAGGTPGAARGGRQGCGPWVGWGEPGASREEEEEGRGWGAQTVPRGDWRRL